ncbi:MAG: transglutaminase family protein [Paracoccaceae bacterium]|nr:transglutaminase family protein [Paracoccaceae bacterium]
MDWLVATNQVVQQMVGYTVRMEPGVQTPETTLKRAIGSCRDSAWLLVQLMRHHGFAARFVSGYLIQLTVDQRSVDGGPDGPDEGFTDLHAWTEIYMPGAGWIEFDTTSGLLAAEGHIPLAATPDPSSAAPISGALEPCEVTFGQEMSVERTLETPRVSAPYTVRQWAEVDALGREIDKRLDKGDVRLTMGGEPTFVAASDRDADEWNTGTVGPTKRAYADKLIRRLRTKFAPNGLMHYGQGKWYPGEQLPRWVLQSALRSGNHWPPPSLRQWHHRRRLTRSHHGPKGLKTLAGHR